MPAKAQYIGTQDFGDGIYLRMYNIVGAHDLEGSTVLVDTLVKEGIEITDMTQEEIEKELILIEKFLKG